MCEYDCHSLISLRLNAECQQTWFIKHENRNIIDLINQNFKFTHHHYLHTAPVGFVFLVHTLCHYRGDTLPVSPPATQSSWLLHMVWPPPDGGSSQYRQSVHWWFSSSSVWSLSWIRGINNSTPCVMLKVRVLIWWTCSSKMFSCNIYIQVCKSGGALMFFPPSSSQPYWDSTIWDWGASGSLLNSASVR